MGWQPALQDNFWEEVTDLLCATIAEGPVTHTSECLDRAFAEAEREGHSLSSEPSLGQAAEDVEYANSIELEPSTDCHTDVTDVKKEPSEDMGFGSPAEEDLNILDLDSSVTQGLEVQQIASDSKPADLTPTRMPTITPSSSRTITPGEPPDAPMSVARKDLNGSPTPAVATAIADHDMMSSRISPADDIEAKSPKRKLTFGMPEFGGEDEVRMPPPKLRKASPTVEDQLFRSFVNSDAVAKPSAEMIFKDIRQPSTAYNPSENDVPKTPLLVAFSLPPSPVVIRDDIEDFYSAFRDGEAGKIPMHVVNSVRKNVDPTFQDDDYWADGLYFCQTPAPSLYCESQESKMHSLDWRIIFHALENDADCRIPLSDTMTGPQMSDGQVNKIWSRFRGEGTEEATVRVKLLRLWTMDQMAESGLKWTEVRGNYSRDPPEYTPHTSQDICKDHDFRIFCGSANFVGGRSAVMPRGPALRNTFGVLKYARLANDRPRPYIGGLPQPQQELLPQHTIPRAIALLSNDDIALENNNRFHPPKPPTPAPTPAPLQLLPPAQLLPTIITARSPNFPPPNRNASLLERAYHDLRVFLSLPGPKLFGMQQQYIRDRARQFTRRNLPIPRDHPTGTQLWGYFRQCVHTNSLQRDRQIQDAREAQVAREAQAGAEAQAIMVRNQFVGPMGERRDLQLASHMPPMHLMHLMHLMTPGSMRAGRGNVGVTALGSPFRTPASGRSACVDPRLLHN